MRIFVPDFDIYHGDTKPEQFFKKVESDGVFTWADEAIAHNFESDYSDEATYFEEVMLKLIGLGLDCVVTGSNGSMYHISTDTFNQISK